MASNKTTSIRFTDKAIDCVRCIQNRDSTASNAEIVNAALERFYISNAGDQDLAIKAVRANKKIQKPEDEDESD